MYTFIALLICFSAALIFTIIVDSGKLAIPIIAAAIITGLCMVQDGYFVKYRQPKKVFVTPVEQIMTDQAELCKRWKKLPI